MGRAPDREVILMKCLICGGRMSYQERTTFIDTFADDRETFPVIITDVPAEVCDQCGEKVYTPEVTDQLPQIIQRNREGKPAPRTVEVLLYSLASLV
jgi:YgiT-type zinc finger domain-containing protein